jgi:hypothetical protein
MARDDSWAQFYRVLLMVLLDGTRPSGALERVSPVAPAVTQAAVGAEHWAAGRRRRALAAWASAAGFGLVAWGLGTEAPSRAEVESIWRQQGDLARKLRTKAPAALGSAMRVKPEWAPRGPCPWPSAKSRRRTPTVLAARTPSAIRPWTPRRIDSR